MFNICTADNKKKPRNKSYGVCIHGYVRWAFRGWFEWLGEGLYWGICVMMVVVCTYALADRVA